MTELLALESIELVFRTFELALGVILAGLVMRTVWTFLQER